MASRREESQVGRRVVEGALTLGVVVLLGGLVSAFVVAGVFLLNRPPGRSDPVPLAQSAAPPEEFVPRPRYVPVARPDQISDEPARQLRLNPSSGVDEEGYIRRWVVLAPILLEKELSGATEIHREQVPGEAKLRPDGKRPWRTVDCADYFIDFRKGVEGQRTDDAAAYAVCLLVLKEERKDLRLQMGSNDQAKVYLNGKAVAVHDQSRTLEKGKEAAGGVTLRKGENLLVFKVINEKNNWQGCLRFVDGGGAAVKELEVSLP